jgi:thiamine biosynthesis lipoprotein
MFGWRLLLMTLLAGAARRLVRGEGRAEKRRCVSRAEAKSRFQPIAKPQNLAERKSLGRGEFSPTHRHLSVMKTPIDALLPLVLLLNCTILPADDTPLQRFSRTERHMGADFTIKLYAADEQTAEQAFKAAFGLVAEYDKSMSDYNAESELSQLGQKSPTKEFVVVSKPLWEVLLRAQEVSEQTDGAFDVTVGPLTKLWRRARRQKELPEEDERQAALGAVGWRNLVVDKDRPAVSLTNPNMRLDLGGIAPGFAADKVLERLRELGIKSALADASGDVALGDAPPGEKGWKVGLAPLKGNGPPERFLELANCAVTTSGDAFRGVEIGGVRYSHIVDPKTGIGLKHRSSVTVIGPNCTTADALATSLSVVGPDKMDELLKHFPSCSAREVWQDGEARVYHTESEDFPK